MEAAVISLVVGLALISGVGGFVLGRARAHRFGFAFHVIFAVVSVWLWAMMENATGWDGIGYLLALAAALMIWVPLVIGHVIGALVARAS